MTRHHRDLRLPAFPRPYPMKGDKRSPHPVERESLRPLLPHGGEGAEPA